jgi:hypothetical protein
MEKPLEYDETSPKHWVNRDWSSRQQQSIRRNQDHQVVSHYNTIPNVLHLRHTARVHPHRTMELEFRRTKLMIDGTCHFFLVLNSSLLSSPLLSSPLLSSRLSTFYHRLTPIVQIYTMPLLMNSVFVPSTMYEMLFRIRIWIFILTKSTKEPSMH